VKRIYAGSQTALTPEKEFVSMEIHLNIDQIVLNGFDLSPGERHDLQASLAAELHRLFSEQGQLGGLIPAGSRDHLRANPVQLSSAGNPGEVGSRIAEAIHASLHGKGEGKG
jgi:hypothetical protein